MYQNQNNQVQQINNTPSTPIKAISNFFNNEKTQEKFSQLLGKKGPNFIASVVSLASSSTDLSKVEPSSIYGAALIAASVDLPIIPSLGYAYIIPYNQKVNGSWVKVAQFQIGYKGLIQLAHRSKEYITIHSSDVREGELVGNNRLTGEREFNWIVDDNERKKLPIIGFVSYFEMVNGFRSTFYMTEQEMQQHAIKFSKTYQKHKSGLWKEEYLKMADKTITKLHLAKKGILSTELQRAIQFDQAATNVDNSNGKDLNIQDIEPVYVDNEPDYSDQEVRYNEESEDEYNQRIFEEQLAKEQEAERLKELQNNPEQQGQSHGGINVSMHNLEQVTNDIKNRKKY